MYEEGKSKWFSQTLLTYKDKKYASDGYMRISISTNTEDFKFFNPPSFSISISNNYQKSCNLNYSDVIDLSKSISDVLQGLNGNDEEIAKVIRDTRLYFKFSIAQNERVIKMTLQNSTTDLTSVVFPLFPTFQAFINVLKYYRDSYPEICKDLLLKTIDSESTSIIHQIPSLIKGISSQILTSNYTDSGAAVEAPPTSLVEQTEITIDALDKFIGPDMTNVKIAEIEEGKVDPKETVVEIESRFVEKVLKNDLYNLEILLESVKLSNNPWSSFGEEVSTQLEAEEGFTIIPLLKSQDHNSISYISKLLFTVSNQAYTTFNTPIASGFPILKYKMNKLLDKGNELNQDLAFDLLLFSGYLRLFRRRVESKSEDASRNGAYLYLMLRCFTDPFIYSILEVCDTSTLKALIVNRYKHYNSLGVFKHYQKELETWNCPVIDVPDIDSFVQEVLDNIIGKTPFVDEFHKEQYSKGQLKMPYEGNYSLEQIINKIVPVESAIKLGKEVEETCSTHKVEDDIKKLFCIKPKVQPKIRTETNLERFVRGDILNEIPEAHRQDFQKYVKELGDKNFVFGKEFPYDEFGDEIVKALYSWKPEDDEKLSKNFAYFTKKFAEVIHTKETILAGNKQETESKSGWDDIQF